MYFPTFLIQILNGVQYGMLLFLVASGLTLVFGIMGIINIAHHSCPKRRQWSRAHSLREIEVGLRSCEGKLAHLGIEAPARSSLLYANGHRPWQRFEKVFYGLFEVVAAKAVGKKKFRFKNKLVSLDQTVIDLCLSCFVHLGRQ